MLFRSVMISVKLTCSSLLCLISEVLSVGICSPAWSGVWALHLKKKADNEPHAQKFVRADSFEHKKHDNTVFYI